MIWKKNSMSVIAVRENEHFGPASDLENQQTSLKFYSRNNKGLAEEMAREISRSEARSTTFEVKNSLKKRRGAPS